MSEATEHEVGDQAAQILDRVATDERVTITRDGKPVARVEPTARGRLSAAVLVGRFRQLPEVDPRRLREDIDALLDQRS